jgi:hypothetical protein
MTMITSHAYAIEVRGRSAGILVARRGGFTFFTAEGTFKDLDGRFFRRVDQAERAARRLLDISPAGRHRRNGDPFRTSPDTRKRRTAP